jgi:SAM-dependent methyltransferase
MIQQVGKQDQGTSHGSIKQMAQRALATVDLSRVEAFADIGAGMGHSSKWLWQSIPKGFLLDHAVQRNDLPPHISYKIADLNAAWPFPAQALDLLISLEVIEHLENPRHFFREMQRVLRPGGYAFISTPYNLNLTARLLFLLKGQHRHFQDLSYPAHITALLPVDFRRMAKETGLAILSFHYNNYDVLPFLKSGFRFRHPLFSNSIGVLLMRNA